MSDIGIHKFRLEDTILRDDSPTLEYKVTGALTKNVHNGQMKMLLADDMGITKGLQHICSHHETTIANIKKKVTKVAVLVVGAATGEHFVGLSNTFSFLDFFLYDPAPYGWSPALLSKWRQGNTNVKIYEWFRLEHAESWSQQTKYKHVIFLCDLRTGDGLVDAKIKEDMELQKQLTVQVGATYSVLKFRPPYHRPHLLSTYAYKYLDGTSYLQAYGPRNSSETRLHVTNVHSTKTYDTKLYEYQLFYHNQVTRNGSINLFQIDGDTKFLMYDDAYALFVKKYMLIELKLRVTDASVRAYENIVTDSEPERAPQPEPEAESESEAEPEQHSLCILLSIWNPDMITELQSYTNIRNTMVDLDLTCNNWLNGAGVHDAHVNGICTLIATAVLEFSAFLATQKYKSTDRARVERKVQVINLFVLTLQSCIRASSKKLACKYARDFQIFYMSFAFAVWTDLDRTTDLHDTMSKLYRSCNILYVYIRYRVFLARLVDDYLVDDTSINTYRVSTGKLPEIEEYATIRSQYDNQMKLVDNTYTPHKPQQRRTGNGNGYAAREPSPERNKKIRPKAPNAYVPPSRQSGYVPKNTSIDTTKTTDTTDRKHTAYVPPHLRRDNTQTRGPQDKSTRRTPTHSV